MPSLWVDEILLPSYGNLSANFRGLPLKVEMALYHLKHLNFICIQVVLWIRFQPVYLRGVQDYLRCLHLLYFLQDIVYFLPFKYKTIFIRSIGVRSTKSGQIMNIYAVTVSPCKTIAIMSKKSVSPSGERSITFVFLWSFNIVVTVSLDRLYAWSICSNFPLCMESNALRKSTNYSVASRFFARTPSMIRRIVGICNVMDWFLWKQF